MLDRKRIEELRAEIGDEDFAEVAEVFLDELAEAMGRLRAGVAPGDLAPLLHFVKGASLNLGFSGLAEIAAEGERLAESGVRVDVAPVLASYDASRAAFEAEFAAAP